MSWLTKIFGSTSSAVAMDYSVLGTDMHAHLIPGIDDGAKDMEQSLELIRGMYELGYNKLIATPHVMSDFYPNTRNDILRGLGQLQRGVRKAGINVTLEAAAEYLMDEVFEDILNADELLTLPGGRYVLVEMSFVAEPPWLYEYLFKMQTKGYTPILAHPERYGYYAGDLEKYENLRQYGCLFQINLLSFNGHYGSDVRRTAEKLVSAGMVEFLGTDLHHRGHLRELEELAVPKSVVALMEEGLLNKTL